MSYLCRPKLITMSQKGKITQVIGPVVDVRFDTQQGSLPKILEAIEVVRPNGQKF
jgi:F-type H+-transporting ATPase subunit beta